MDYVHTTYFTVTCYKDFCKLVDSNDNITILDKQELRELYGVLGDVIAEQDKEGE